MWIASDTPPIYPEEKGLEKSQLIPLWHCPIAEWSGTIRSYVLTIRQDYTTTNTFIETLWVPRTPPIFSLAAGFMLVLSVVLLLLVSFTGFLSCHRQYCIPLGQEQRKDYKLYLHWGRVHPESASGPRLPSRNVSNVFPSLSQSAPIELMVGGFWDKCTIIMWI